MKIKSKDQVGIVRSSYGTKIGILSISVSGIMQTSKHGLLELEIPIYYKIRFFVAQTFFIKIRTWRICKFAPYHFRTLVVSFEHAVGAVTFA